MIADCHSNEGLAMAGSMMRAVAWHAARMCSSESVCCPMVYEPVACQKLKHDLDLDDGM